MRIGIDLDEVVSDSIPALIKFHNERHGTRLKKDDFHSYDFWKVAGGTREEAIKEFLEFFMSDAARNIDPIAGSLRALTTLKEKGHELYIITARQNDIVGQTEEWIERNFPQLFVGAHFANAYNFTGEERKKSEICKELKIDVFIDDRLEYVRECAAVGVRALLFDQPWNRKEVALPANVERVFSWDEIVKKI